MEHESRFVMAECLNTRVRVMATSIGEHREYIVSYVFDNDTCHGVWTDHTKSFTYNRIYNKGKMISENKVG